MNPQQIISTAILIKGMLQATLSNVPGAASNGQGSFNHMQGSLKLMENNFNTLVQNAQQPTTTTTTPSGSVSTTPVNTTGINV